MEMGIQITLIGLGQIGASIGLALSDHTDLVQRVGHDREPGIARKAEKMGAVDQAELNLPASVREADLVVLALPMDQIRETMEIIAPDLREGTVVMDTSPVKEIVAAWASELLPPERYYIGLTPVINPAYLHEVDSGLEAARADMFKGGLIAIAAPPRTNSEAVKLAADLTRLLGSSPLFIDPLEVDSMMAATHLLPQILAASLLNATVDQPGWREGRKLAGRGYAEATGPLVQLSEPKTLSASVLFNRENMLRVIDGTMAALQSIRADIQEENGDALEERLERARRGREKWWRQRQANEWAGPEATASVELPTSSEVFGRLFGLGRKPKDKK
jgi:prephenate dehydrogenase